MAGSMLHAAGLQELVANDHAQYEEIVLALSNNPQRIAELKQKLERESANWGQAPQRLVASLERQLIDLLNASS
jgi:hypothetical protein